MKITNLDIYLAKEWRTFLFVKIETDEGIYGIGESGITSRELAVAGALEHLKPLIIGESPFRTEHIWQKLWRGGFYPSGELLSAAISAIDIALWDIKGKYLNVPVYELLGGLYRDKVLTYNHLNCATTETTLEHCQRSVAEGWKCVRWEFSTEPAQNNGDRDNVFVPHKAIDRAVEQWELIRKTVGNDLELCFDVHTKLNVPDAVRFCRAVEPYRPFFIEDPIRSESPDSYKHLRNQTSVPIAAGEQFSGKWDFAPLIENQLIDYARFDICIGGGITEGQKIAAMSESRFIELAVHNPVGPVSTAASLHLNLAIPNMGVMELPRRPGETMADVFTSHIEWQDGYLLAPTKPGLGIEFNPEKLENYTFEITELPHLQRIDGSFTNW